MPICKWKVPLERLGKNNRGERMENGSSECKCQMKNEKQNYGEKPERRGNNLTERKAGECLILVMARSIRLGLGAANCRDPTSVEKVQGTAQRLETKVQLGPRFFVPPSSLSLLTHHGAHLIVFLIFLAQPEEVATDLASNLQEKDNCWRGRRRKGWGQTVAWPILIESRTTAMPHTKNKI